MIKTHILSPIIGSGIPKIDPFRPQFGEDYSAITYTDVTARPTEVLIGVPETITIEATCLEEQVAILELDNRYFVISTEVIDETTQSIPTGI
jgi:hypothetical protein